MRGTKPAKSAVVPSPTGGAWEHGAAGSTVSRFQMLLPMPDSVRLDEASPAERRLDWEIDDERRPGGADEHVPEGERSTRTGRTVVQVKNFLLTLR